MLTIQTPSTPAVLECIEYETGPNPTYTVIWLHGLAADSHQFVDFARALQLPATPALRFIFPQAPQQRITLSGGQSMPAWYDILTTDFSRQDQEDVAGIRASEKAMRTLIEREKTRGIDSKHIILAGFSQGCAIALYTGLRLAEPLAGIIALSGYLPQLDHIETERHDANAKTPIFLAHGQHDTVISVAQANRVHNTLKSLGYAVQWHTYPAAHLLYFQEEIVAAKTDLKDFFVKTLH